MARDSTPIPLAHVRVRGEDGLERAILTDSKGRYTVIVSGGGAYELRVRAFGYVPLSVVVQRAPDVVIGGTRIERGVQLNAIPVTLTGVNVVASPSIRTVAAPGDRNAQWLTFLR
jgi:hypothetical protein